MAKRYPHVVFPCIGVHPWFLSESDLEAIEGLIHANHDKLVGIGEIGMDYASKECRADPDRIKPLQQQAFERQVRLAVQYDLPVNVHSRQASDDCLAILRRCGAKKVLLHAYDGKPAVAEKAAADGYFFSVPCSVATSKERRRWVRRVPLEVSVTRGGQNRRSSLSLADVALTGDAPLQNLLLETDSPFMPMEGESRSVFWRVQEVARCVAELKGVTTEEVVAATTRNCLRLFSRIPR